MLAKKLVAKIKNYFSQKPEIVAVYLYGSYARGEAKETSDIDMGVVLKEKPSSRAFEIPQVKFSQDLAKILGEEVEVQDITNCDLEFAHRVLSEGKLLYSGDEKRRIEFETTIVGAYFDMKPLFEEYYRQLLKIAKKGELHVRYTPS